MQISLKTLTPLWTGGVDQTTDRLHETGLMGSLRWWFEALVRGLGGYACDPTEHSCIFDEEKYRKSKATNERQRMLDAGVCDACQIFGATGWRRRFRLVIQDSTQMSGPNGSQQPAGTRFRRGSNQPPSWYFKGGRTGKVVLQIIPTDPRFDPLLIQGTLRLIARWGGLASKPQLGYGWVGIESDPSLVWDAVEFLRRFQDSITAEPQANNGLPSLDKMFFAQLQTSDQSITATLNVRYDLRAAFRKAFEGNQTLRHWVCGSVKGDQRQASKISVTQAVNGTLRVWGWIPEDIPVHDVMREQVVYEIKRTLEAYGKLDYWREFNSPRDTISQQTDIRNYLLELLKEA